MEKRKGVAEFDKNMAVNTTIDEPDLVWLSVLDEPFRLHGVWFDHAGERSVSNIFYVK